MKTIVVFLFAWSMSAHAFGAAVSDPCVPTLPATFTMKCNSGEYHRPDGYWIITIQAIVLPEYCDSHHPNSIVGQSASATYTGFTEDANGNPSSYPPIPVYIESNFRTDFDESFFSRNVHSDSCVSSARYANGQEFHYDSKFVEGEFISQKPGSCPIAILDITRDGWDRIKKFTATLGSPCSGRSSVFQSIGVDSGFRSSEGYELYLMNPNSIQFSDLNHVIPAATYYRKGF